jgi:hypothetical protein
MTVHPIRVVSFDPDATLAMGEAFDRACKSLRNFGSAVPSIIANQIIEAAKNGERDPGRLYEKILKTFGIDGTSMTPGSGGRDHPVPAYAFVTRAQRDR